MWSRVGYTLLPIGYMGLLYYLSSIPGGEIEEIGIRIPDYLLHAAAYAVLALLLHAALRRAWQAPPRTAWWIAWMVAVVYGVTDEYHQSFVPGRDPSLKDLVADALGAAMALSLWTRWANRHGRQPQLRLGSRRRP
ncbi:MAG TPA: VanZ family protein [Limnochordia bacterium]|jgi:Predicted integral membrane protein|nr:VanZ family protein [Limnochordia bacterium]